MFGRPRGVYVYLAGLGMFTRLLQRLSGMESLGQNAYSRARHGLYPATLRVLAIEQSTKRSIVKLISKSKNLLHECDCDVVTLC